MKNKIILKLIIILGIVVSGFYLISRTDNQDIDTINTNEVATTTESVLLDTSDWETCRNEEYGYEFKYPRGWYMYSTFTGPEGTVEKKQFTCTGPTVVFFSQKNGNINNFIFKVHRQIYNWNQTLKEYFDIIHKELYFVSNPEFVLNNKINFLRYKRLDGYPEALLLNKKTLFILSSNIKNKENIKIFNTILSTFKFID